MEIKAGERSWQADAWFKIDLIVWKSVWMV